MKPQDLRIGNYINALDDYDQAIASQVIALSSGDADIDEYGNRILFYTLNGEYAPDQCKIEGVKITEEWLVKFNFDLGWIIEHNTESFCLIQQGVNYYYSADMHHHTSRPIEYIHQLQNLYFALTGKELSIS